MDDPAILFVKPQAIAPEDRALLADAGVVVIEVADPRDVKLVRATADLPGSELLRIAADTIYNKGGTEVRAYFGSLVCQALMRTKNDRDQ